MLKFIATIFILLLLNGCAQNAALLGPVITGASTGSTYQAALSYGSGKALNKITGKTADEYIKTIFNQTNDKKKLDESHSNFLNSVKKHIDRSSSIKDLVNQ
tara:strand:- start:742 stop:1047 length:306 start_codon:yes stop_codon:yes gene_type:complete